MPSTPPGVPVRRNSVSPVEGRLGSPVARYDVGDPSNMAHEAFYLLKERLEAAHASLIERKNEPLPESNGWFRRYRYPVLTAAHAPIFWRYDLDPTTNPLLLERLGVNAVFNVGAMEWK